MKLTMMFKLDLKKVALATFRTPAQNGDKDIMLIFVSEKNRPLLLAEGVVGLLLKRHQDWINDALS